MQKRIDKIEIHVQQYGIAKSADPKKNGKPVGLKTRLIIHKPQGYKVKHDFDRLSHAEAYIKKNYGELKDGNYMVLSNWKLYGSRGYKWD